MSQLLIESTETEKSVANKTLTTKTASCIRCEEPATLICNACSNAPIYDEPAPLPMVFYCSKNCKRVHQRSARCKDLHERKILFRNATVLKKALLVIRRSAWDADVERVERKGEFLYVYEGAQERFRRGEIYVPFPDNLGDDAEVIEAVLCQATSMSAMAMLSFLAHDVLSDVYENYEHVCFVFKNPIFKTVAVFADHDTKGNRPVHEVMRITTSRGNVWAIDPTSAQYGLRETLIPWSTYENKHIAKILPEVQDSHSHFFAATGIDRSGVDMYHAGEYRSVCEAWESFLTQEVLEKLRRSVLRGSEEEYNRDLDLFLMDLGRHLDAHVAQMYLPVSKREREIEWKEWLLRKLGHRDVNVSKNVRRSPGSRFWEEGEIPLIHHLDNLMAMNMKERR